MESSLSSDTEPDVPPGVLHRWLLAVGAACAVGALGWAAVQVQAAKSEVQELKEELAVAQRNERAAAAAARAVPAVDNSSRLTALEQTLAEADKTRKQAAAREKELNEVIAFLRKENTAAQETIKRLSAPPPEPVPDPAPATADPAPPPAGAPATAPTPPPEPEGKKRSRRR